MIRDYTIHLRIDRPETVSVERMDEIVQDVVDASTAREAIQTGIDYAVATAPEWESPTLENFYVVSATRPEGGIG